ncbi:RagB/SusD family nutrient uptake outer membrane protein [Plebeiibacterium sediminum]|uniref:RagB/SusD family nutrient uptake outer membrane protein n=1 Tax=Plebeiibacterium sediminum TaxID=2992112 RepID=A0AAE3M0S1_9BACT|nr:RagB/SusD family nutrient uptake outer membrane protein [Plebeiobacterium sediminum]MCW3784883.1 RagB/SusD family nutrient uptake outer membrane protein [Plebeiobacterium sediminum]
MKRFFNIKLLGLLVAASTLMTSCEEYLEEDNYTSLSIEAANGYTETFEQLVTRVYEVSREYTTHYDPDMYYSLEDLGTDLVTRNDLVSGTNDLNDYVNFNSTNWTVSVYWRNQYKIISAANFAIEASEVVEGLDEGDKATGVGEAKFFRAMSYFNLVENYGGVPLVLRRISEPETNFTRETEQNVYTQIVSDLNDALAAVPETTDDFGRVTKDAVRHLMSKVLLTRAYKPFASGNDFTDAAELAETVISHHDLVPSYADLVSINNQRNSEVVFSYLFGTNSVSRGWGNSRHMLYKFRFYDYPGLSRTVQGLRPMPTPFFFSLFDDADERAEASFVRTLYATEQAKDDNGNVIKEVGEIVIHFPKVAWTDAEKAAVDYAVINPDEYLTADGITNVHYPLFRKFDDPSVPFTQPDQSSQGQRDMVMMRSGEAYLIAAEAYLGSSNTTAAAQKLTELRSRAGLTTPVAEGEVTLDFILDERGRELMGEVNRWMDLKRTGKLIERTLAHNPHAALNHALEAKHLLRPIPQSEIDYSGGSITQNPEYN